MTMPLIPDHVLLDLKAGWRAMDHLPNEIVLEQVEGPPVEIDITLIQASLGRVIQLFDIDADQSTIDQVKVLLRQAKIHLRLGDPDTALRLQERANVMLGSLRGGF